MASQQAQVSASFIDSSTTITIPLSTEKTLRTTIDALGKQLVNQINSKYGLHLSHRLDVQYWKSHPPTEPDDYQKKLSELPPLELFFRSPAGTSHIYNEFESKDQAIADLGELLAEASLATPKDAKKSKSIDAVSHSLKKIFEELVDLRSRVEKLERENEEMRNNKVMEPGPSGSSSR